MGATGGPAARGTRSRWSIFSRRLPYAFQWGAISLVRPNREKGLCFPSEGKSVGCLYLEEAERYLFEVQTTESHSRGFVFPPLTAIMSL